MPNSDTQAAWKYHNATNHSVASVSAPHFLDWSNHPRPYKLYKDELDAVPLPTDFPSSGVPALEAISTIETLRQRERFPGLNTLATLLHYSAGVTRWLPIHGGKMAFRAAACTGALYHIELYLVCGPLPDLEAGVYQFGVHDSRLRRLRRGDYRSVLAQATGGAQAVSDAPLVIACTSTFWRNAWKYRSRAYRHAFWDSGVILANTLAEAVAHRLPAQVVAGFDDGAVNRLLDIDGEKEAAICLVPLGFAPSMRPGASPPVERLNLATIPPSRTEVDYPALRDMHNVSSLHSPQEVAAWRGARLSMSTPAPEGKLVPLAPAGQQHIPQDSLEQVIGRRGSSRRFQQTPITFEHLSTILVSATQGIPADFLEPAATLNHPYLIVNAVEGLASGTYVYHRQQRGLELLREGHFRDAAGGLALGQDLGADAAVNVYFLAPLCPVLEQLGNRGYRAAHLDASVTAGKLWVAAYALGLGASGLTFFDDDVTRFFSPHAADKSVMFLITLGHPSPRRSG